MDVDDKLFIQRCSIVFAMNPIVNLSISQMFSLRIQV